MELESELGKAFYGVYNSSREIVKNNQRNLFCNMLDLLSRTIKTVGDKCSNIEECMLFWIRDILPLVFDEDKDIQKSAITAMEIVTSTFKFKNVHVSSYWNEMKPKIVQEYSKNIYAYRESSNSHWFRIWCILIRILDKEIMKGASTINTFLSIVEQGFRSPDHSVRIEAFHCWKVLIEVFANNGEICSPKRIRLVCIPLKSSHSKTSHAAVVKLKVWWFLITKIGEKIEQHIDTVLEPFFAFCYGLLNRNNSRESDIKIVTSLCMISLSGTPTKLIKKKMELYDIECLPQPLLNKYIMNKCWNLALTCAAESIKDSSNVSSIEDECTELLFRSTLMHVINTERNDILHFFFEKLAGREAIIQTYFKCEHLSTSVKCIKDETFIGNLVFELCKYVLPAKLKSSLNIIDECISLIFLKRPSGIENALNTFLSRMLTMPMIPSTDLVDNWKVISGCLIKIFSKYCECVYHPEENLLNKWILWPLEACAHSREHDLKMFDKQLEALLQTAFELNNGFLDKATIMKDISMLFRRMLDSKLMDLDLNVYFTLFMRLFASSYMLVKYDENLTSVTFELLKMHIPRELTQVHIDLCMNCLKSLIMYMGESETDKHLEDIKDIWLRIVEHKRKNGTQNTNLDDYKRQLLDDIKNIVSKETHNKIKGYLENDDIFVIIPAVWSLNPDKLTTRQREKLLEKSDNIDMSQSQDTFIKPWTPKKIVIAKGQLEEIALSDKPESNNLNGTTSPSNASINKEDTLHLNSNAHIDLCKPDQYTNKTNDKHCNRILKHQEYVQAKNYQITDELQAKQNFDEFSDPVEAMILKDTSSPPDRKQTNNSTSPLLKPKTTHLTGRGAQLINMIRNKKHENYNSKQLETSTPISKADQSHERVDAYLNWSSADSDPKPSPVNLLVFSKTLPSPCASPSASILKRKHQNDSMDDIYCSQAYKRKRVSFHDPPVSVTKEYLRDEENKNNSKRCLLLDQESRLKDQGSTKHLLRRSTKIDAHLHNEQISDLNTMTDSQLKTSECDLMAFDEHNPKTDADCSSLMLKTPYPYIFKTEQDVFDFVKDHFPIENVCEKYLSDDKTGTVENNLTKFISSNMNINPKFKSNVLETLAEKHSKEFLTYAIQENLSSTICDRLNLNYIIDYISHKSLTNSACRSRLFEEVQGILNFEKNSDEKWEFIKRTITSSAMTDQQILNLIELLFESKRKHQTAVSESAIDSSSTL